MSPGALSPGALPWPWTTLVALAALALCVALWGAVSRARKRHHVMAPATDGPEPFRRAFRVHQNTMEQLPLFLVPLFLVAWAWGDEKAALIGLWWPVGRVVYALRYQHDPARRAMGFGLALLSSTTLSLVAAVAALRTLFAP